MRTYRHAILPLFAVALAFGAATNAHAGQDAAKMQEGAANQMDAEKQIQAMKQDGLTDEELGQLEWRLNNDETLTPYEQELIYKQLQNAGVQGYLKGDETVTPYERKLLEKEQAAGTTEGAEEGASPETAELKDADHPEDIQTGEGGTLTYEKENQ